MGVVSLIVHTFLVGVMLLVIIVNGNPLTPEKLLDSSNHTLNGTAKEFTKDFNASDVILNKSPSSLVNSSFVETLSAKKGPVPSKRVGKLIGFELGLGLGPGLGYGGYGYGGLGGYGSVPFPCSTTRLAAFGFPYYNPVCYGYAVPSFPYYGGPLG